MARPQIFDPGIRFETRLTRLAAERIPANRLLWTDSRAIGWAFGAAWRARRRAVGPATRRSWAPQY